MPQPQPRLAHIRQTAMACLTCAARSGNGPQTSTNPSATLKLRARAAPQRCQAAKLSSHPAARQKTLHRPASSQRNSLCASSKAGHFCAPKTTVPDIALLLGFPSPRIHPPAILVFAAFLLSNEKLVTALSGGAKTLRTQSNKFHNPNPKTRRPGFRMCAPPRLGTKLCRHRQCWRLAKHQPCEHTASLNQPT